MKVSMNKLGINPLYCVVLPEYTGERIKTTNLLLQTLLDKDIILLLESSNRGGFHQ